MNMMHVRVAQSESDINIAYSIRKTVFVEEQKVPLELEIDEYEQESTHFLLYGPEQNPIGTGRLRFVDRYGKVERICILASDRIKGAGRLLMDSIEEYAKEKGIRSFKLNAQTSAIGFYEKLGYHTVSEEFMDAGIPHKTMVKQIAG